MKRKTKRLLIEFIIVFASIILLFVLTLPKFFAAQTNINNEWNFPDPGFRKLVEMYMGVNSGGKFTAKEAAAKTEVFRGQGTRIRDIKGIEFFENVIELELSGNDMEKLDLSKNPNLIIVDCSLNLLTEVNLSKNLKLINFKCAGNSLTHLDLRGNPNLEWLDCSANHLESLDISHNTVLAALDARNNRLRSIDLSHNTKLQRLELANCPTFDDPKYYSAYPQFLRLKFFKNQFETIPDISNLPSLRFFDLRNNPLTEESEESLKAVEEKVGKAETYTLRRNPLVYLKTGFAYLPYSATPALETTENAP